MGNINTVGPNEALIVSGGCFGSSKKKIVVGGWCWSWWMLTNIQKISLQIMTLTPKCEHVETTHSVPITVTGVVHCKIMSNDEFLPLAAEQFLGKSIDHIKSVILHTLEGHMRAVIGTQTVEDIYKKRQTFAGLIREAAATDLTRMGIDIMSLTIKDISDNVEYLVSLGKKSTAKVRCDAAIQVERSKAEAMKVESLCEKEITEKKVLADTVVAKFNHETSLKEAEFKGEVGKKKAEADLAYDLEATRMRKDLREKELNVEMSIIDGQIKIEEKKVNLLKKQLEIDVILPAKSEAYAIRKNAEAKAEELRIASEAEASRSEIIGKAEAAALERVGIAETEGMKQKADSFKTYNNAATLSKILAVIPEIAAEIAAPFTKIDQITLISEGDPVSSKSINALTDFEKSPDGSIYKSLMHKTKS